MKYVMFTNRITGLRAPAFASAHVLHSEISIGKDWIPTSAGEFIQHKPPTDQECARYLDLLLHSGMAGAPPSKDRVVSCVGFSESLKLSPAVDDADICFLVLANMEAALFLVQDLEEGRRALQLHLAKLPARSLEYFGWNHGRGERG